ncbi:MAG: ComEC/Rec2 family competence protein [Alphaproteobacteria bacterium]|nr:ComEC/Rec2 family competence protein [Alphaproteobacteria bacterium]
MKSLFLSEYKHLSNLFVPVLMMGILTALSGVSLHWLIIGTGLSAAIISIIIKRFHCFKPTAWLLIFLLGGYTLTTGYLKAIHTPTLAYPLYDLDFKGKITEKSLTTEPQKIIVSDVHFLNRIGEITPEKIKLTYPKSEPVLSVGDTITVRGFLRPPMPSVYPYSYDERHRLFLEGIGAVGQIREVLSVHTHPSEKQKSASVRSSIAERLRALIPDETAQIAIPLTIGDQSVVSPRLYHLFRKAGITHMLSVSGFHLSLLAAFVFLLIRSVLSFFPVIVERTSTKKIAAIVALICSTAYIFISGLQIPAVRSWVMLTIVLIALMFDRNAISVRSLSIAAFLILIVNPPLILNIGFQLSFMAVLVLTTLYQPLRHFIWPNKPIGFPGRFMKGILGFILVDALITLATTPLTIYHFNQYALYSCIGNVLTGTLMSFWIMPMLFIGLVLMPFGCDAIFIKGAALGLEYVISVCEMIDHWPKAITIVPSFSTGALLCMIGGIMVLCLLKTHLRWMGIPIILTGIIVAVIEPKPDLMIGDKGSTIAIRQTDGHLSFLKISPNDYTARIWLLKNGEEYLPELPRPFLPDSIVIKGKQIAFSDTTCSSADICFLPVPNPRQRNAYPLYHPDNRMIYIRPTKIIVKTL